MEKCFYFKIAGNFRCIEIGLFEFHMFLKRRYHVKLLRKSKNIEGPHQDILTAKHLFYQKKQLKIKSEESKETFAAYTKRNKEFQY